MTDWIETNRIKNNFGFSIIISKENKKQKTQVSSIRDQENEKFRIIWFG